MMTIPVIKNNLLSNHIGQEKISILIDIQIRVMSKKNRICKHYFSFQSKNIVNMRNGRNVLPLGPRGCIGFASIIAATGGYDQHHQYNQQLGRMRCMASLYLLADSRYVHLSGVVTSRVTISLD